MSVYKRILNVFKPEKRSISYGPVNAIGLPYLFPSYSLSVTLSMQLSAVYRCVEVVSDAVASQMWELFEYSDKDGWKLNHTDPTIYMLNYDISPAMSKWVMMKTVVAKMLLDGNAYMVIKRPIDMGDPTSLELVNDIVKIYQRDDGTVYYEIERPGDKPYRVDGQDMIHIPNFTYDGINGVSTLRHAANTLALAYYSESTAKGFFSSGANMAGILQVEGRLDKDKADGIKESWRKAFNINSGEPGGIAVMEGGLTFTPVTINPKDAQMLETRQYNVVDICRFFGVHPSKVFDDKNLTYSNIESFQLGFYTDTIGPLNSKIEAEFNRKLLRPGKRRTRKFNLNMDELLKANLDAKSNYYRKMLETGAISPNEIADKIGMPKVKGGDKRYVPMNLIPVDAPITQNKQIDKNININGKGDKDNTE